MVEGLMKQLSFDWAWRKFSRIHHRLFTEGRCIDFWPTTGKWLDHSSGLKGEGFDGLRDQVLKSVPLSLLNDELDGF
jgi:hypothetical protein